VTYEVSADAWIEQNSPSSNKGDDSILKVKAQGSSDNFRALVHFPLPAAAPEGCAVESATLRLYSDSWTSGRTIEALQLAATWSENSVAWGNQPATAGTAATTASGQGYREWSVGFQVQAMFDTGAVHGFLIRDAVEGGSGAEQSFFSREKGENPPTLVVSYNVPPPPDETAPETTLDTWPSSTTTSTGATFTFWANEPDATYECSLDAAAFTACYSPQAYTGLSVGAHTFAVHAIDAAGNVDPTPASYAWTIEAAPPPADCGPAVTVFADADAWIDQDSASSNKGDDSILKVQAKSSKNVRALVRFIHPAVPQGCVVESATLRLYASSWKNNRTLQALQVAGAWTESNVTWNNQPATTGMAATTTSGSGWREWNVTTQVQAMVDSGANNGFLIRDATEGGSGREQQFHSREKGENVPMLILTFGPAGG
jgi:hypothetical protein